MELLAAKLTTTTDASDRCCSDVSWTSRPVTKVRCCAGGCWRRCPRRQGQTRSSASSLLLSAGASVCLVKRKTCLAHPPLAVLRWSKLAVATSPWHTFRSGLTFQCAAKSVYPAGQQPEVRSAHSAAEAGLNIKLRLSQDVAVQIFLARQEIARPAEQSVAWQAAGQVLAGFDSLREVAALVYYWLRGWLC